MRTHDAFGEGAEAMRTSRASLTAFLLLLAAGCARSHTPATTPSPASAGGADSARASRDIPVQIDNQNFSEMSVYLMNNGGKWLVGSVGGMTKSTLTVPASVSPADHRLRLRAEPVGGGGAITTSTLVVPPGQQVYWTIGSDQASSDASAG